MAHIRLGYKVRDKLTGFEGVVVSRTEWLHGCVRVGVQSEELKDGAPIEQQVFDEPQLEELAVTDLVAEGVNEPPRPKGGPRPDPRHRDIEQRQ